MNKILFSILLLITMAPAVLAQDTIRIYYDSKWKEISNKDDAVFYRKAWAVGNNNWIANDYYINNKIQMTGTFKSKKMEVKHGHFTYFYENEKKTSEGNYFEDKFVGLWTAWFENGQKKWEGEYKDNVPDGNWKYWYETGEIKSEGKYLNNDKSGVWNHWHTNGKLECVETFTKDGNSTFQSYYETGEKKSEGKYLNNNKSGVWNHWYTNGKLECVETFAEGGNSTFQSYFENGAKKCQGIIENYLPDGLWSYWNSDGRIFLKGKFERGLKTGEWTRYFPNGEEMKLQFKFGVVEGKEFGGVELSE
ncbi:MAG: hypothetical protein V2A54_05990 [Bacteroidota bacterium]